MLIRSIIEIPNERIHLFFTFFRIIIFSFFSLFCENTYSQKTSEQIKAGYIYNFIKNITWKNEHLIDTFIVSMYGDDVILKAAINQMNGLTVKSKQIKVKEFFSIKDIAYTHVLVITNDHNAFVKDVMETIEGKNILLITDGCEFQRYVMLNYTYNANSKIQFEINSKNIEEAGLVISPKLILLGGTEIDVRKLYLETEKKLLNEKEKTESYVKELNRKGQEIEAMEARLKLLDKEIDSTQREFLSQNNKLLDLTARNKIQQVLLDEKSRLHFQQKRHLEERNKELVGYQNDIKTIRKEIDEYSAILNTQKIEIEKRQKIIERQDATLVSQIALINKQRSFLYLLLAIIIMTIAIIFLIYRNYKINRRKNLELEKQRDLTNKQMAQIAEQNNELEMHRQNLEIMVQQRTSDLIKAKDKAEESDRLKSSFLANMSHEIRTPLNAIIGFLSIIKDEVTTPDTKNQYIDIIQNSSEMLLQLINDILDFALIESGQLRIKISEENLFDLIRTTFSGYKTSRIMQSKSNLQLKLSLSRNDIYINTDPFRFKQVLSNLIDNALKYTESGYIEIGFTTQINQATIYVRDTGIGIPPDKHNLVFERFAKIEDSNTRLYRGIGLGLAISKKLTELMGGKMWVESELQKGSCFYFTQSSIENHKNKVNDIAEAHDSSTILFTDKIILICEDDDSSYLFLKNILTGRNLTLIRANNGLEAINLCKSEIKPDLILMDIKMPLIDGVEAAQIIKKEINSKTPIIAQTAYATVHEKQKYHPYFDDYITKPIMKADLYATLNKFLYFGK